MGGGAFRAPMSSFGENSSLSYYFERAKHLTEEIISLFL